MYNKVSYLEGQHSLIIPIRWSKEEIKAREKFRCAKHGHDGISHKSCYDKEMGTVERKGCLDIESGNLDADFGIVLSWTIKVSEEETYYTDHITKKDLQSGNYDARLLSTLVKKLWEFDRLITHYGINGRFDIPFIRARYLWLVSRKMYKGQRFPGYGEMYVSDTYSMAKKLLKISSRRQNVVATVIQGIDVKTPIDRDRWLAIQYGNMDQREAAIEYIVEHNIKDTQQLDQNYLLMLPFVRELKSSI